MPNWYERIWFEFLLCQTYIQVKVSIHRSVALCSSTLIATSWCWIFLKVWSLIHCIANKIKKIKQIEIGSPQLADNLNDLNRISDELSDSLGWIEAELPGRTAINKQTNSFKQKLNYWMRIMNEFKLLRSAKIRQKEIKKVKILLGFGKWPEITDQSD